MSNYRLPEIDLSIRKQLTLEMLKPIPERAWGRATELSEQYGVSRKFLYNLRDQGLAALSNRLLPQKTGPKIEQKSLEINQGLIERAIVVLPMVKGSVRDIQHGLRLLFGIKRSVGYISQTLTAAGERAAEYNQGIEIPFPILGEADELCQGRQPCLTVVDGRSFMVVNLTPAASYDKTSWGVTYLNLVARGIQFHDLVCDGGPGLRAGVKEAELSIPLRPDLFHLLREAHKITKQLERVAYQAIQTTERAYQAGLEELGLICRPGRPLKVKVTLPAAERDEIRRIETFDNWSWLLSELRAAWEPITTDYRIASAAEAKATLVAVTELIKELANSKLTTFAASFEKKIAELLAPLEWLEQELMPLLENMDVETQAFILWVGQHRHEMDVNINTIIPKSLSSQALAIWNILGLFHRSSSLAESLHSWLRPYLHIHRGMPKWLFPLLQFFWNHHTFQRGKREGSSPLELAGVEAAPSLVAALDQLLSPSMATQPA
ncbi:MAG: hypothetical protein U9Q70_04410 [Chloroflexota bacterium]|nr:hypothetical protein [Chloroflexota bacterium]